MRHKLSGRKLGRTAAHRAHLFRNMVTSLLGRGYYETTLPKAKEVRRIAEKFVTLGKDDNLANRKKAHSYLKDKAVIAKLFKEIGPQFKARKGGYIRVTRSRVRHGDGAEMAYIELLSEDRLGSSAKEAVVE